MALSSFRSISSFGSVTCYSGLRARLLTRVPNLVTSIIVTANETLLRSLKTMEKYYGNSCELLAKTSCTNFVQLTQIAGSGLPIG